MNKHLLLALRDIASWRGRYYFRQKSMQKLAALGYVERAEPMPGDPWPAWRITDAGCGQLRKLTP